MDDTGSLQDELLVLRSQQGDQGSFEQLVQRWQPALVNYAYHVTGDRTVTEDIVQETWLAVICGLVTLKDVSCFRAWLFRLASHKCQDYWRRNYSSRRLAEDSRTGPDAYAAPPGTARMDMEAAFRRLPSESRTVLALMYLEDFSVGEIAGMLSLPEGTVKSHLFHARQQLRQLMEKDYGTDRNRIEERA
jgi:RNA polymerase sigma factor (sigma-70 family)